MTSYDSTVREQLKPYLDDVLTEACKTHVSEVHIFGSLVRGGFTRNSDVDVFLVLDEYNYPGWGDITAVCLSDVPEAVEQGVGRQPGDRWQGRENWGLPPEDVVELLPDYLVRSMRRAIGTPFRTGQTEHWVDIFFGSKNDLNTYATKTERISTFDTTG